jgi:hypothetical protein
MPDTITAPPTTEKPAVTATPETHVQPELTEGNSTGSAEDIKKSFDDLEARWTARNPPLPGEKPASDLEKKPDATPAKEDETPPEAPKPDAAKEAKTAVSAPKALRMALDKAESELKTHQAKVADLEAKYKAAEEKGKSTTLLAERLAAAEKERDDARASLRAAKQETSPEFHEKYVKPFEEAADMAREEIGQLNIINPETEEPFRKADWSKDFASLYQLERPEARVMAERMFGKEADLVMSHYTELHRLDRVRGRALEAEKASWAERTKADQAAQVRNREGWNAGIKEATDYLVKAYPQFFAEDPKDPDGSALIKEGMEFVNSKPTTFKEAVIHRAAMQMYAAAHPRLKASVERLSKENAELKKTIEELKGAGPGTTKRPSGAEPAPEKGFLESFREEMRD